MKKFVLEVSLEEFPTVESVAKLLRSLGAAMPRVMGDGRRLVDMKDGQIVNEAQHQDTPGKIISRAYVKEEGFDHKRTISDGVLTDADGKNERKAPPIGQEGSDDLN